MKCWQKIHIVILVQPATQGSLMVQIKLIPGITVGIWRISHADSSGGSHGKFFVNDADLGSTFLADAT